MHTLIQVLLQRRKVAPVIDFHLVRQVVRHFLLGSSQHKRHDPKLQGLARHPLKFGVFFVKFGEMRPFAQIPGLKELENRPQIPDAVFHRRAGKRHFQGCADSITAARHVRVGIANHTRLVQYHEGVFPLHEQSPVIGQNAVTCYNYMTLFRLLMRDRSFVTVDQHGLQRGRKTADL